MNLSEHLEQAVLGALLHQPHQIAKLRAWMRPNDFTRTDHVALYRAMLELDDTGATPGGPASTNADAASYRAELTQHLTSIAELSGVGIPYAQALMAATPTPDAAAQYGRMVLEASTQRVIGQYAAAHAAHPANAEDELVRQEAELVRRSFTALAAATSPTRDPDDGGEANASGEGQDAVAAAAQWAAQIVQDDVEVKLTREALDAVHAVIVGPVARGDEEQVLAALVQDPGELEHLEHWLNDTDFADAGNAALYSAALAIHDRGDLVDEFTVLWEAYQREAFTTGALTVDDAMRMLRAPTPGAGAAAPARRVLNAAVRRVAVREAVSLESVAQLAISASHQHPMGPEPLAASSGQGSAPAADVEEEELHRAYSLPELSTDLNVPWTLPSPPSL